MTMPGPTVSPPSTGWPGTPPPTTPPPTGGIDLNTVLGQLGKYLSSSQLNKLQAGFTAGYLTSAELSALQQSLTDLGHMTKQSDIDWYVKNLLVPQATDYIGRASGGGGQATDEAGYKKALLTALAQGVGMDTVAVPKGMKSFAADIQGQVSTLWGDIQNHLHQDFAGAGGEERAYTYLAGFGIDRATAQYAYSVFSGNNPGPFYRPPGEPPPTVGPPPGPGPTPGPAPHITYGIWDQVIADIKSGKLRSGWQIDFLNSMMRGDHPGMQAAWNKGNPTGDRGEEYNYWGQQNPALNALRRALGLHPSDPNPWQQTRAPEAPRTMPSSIGTPPASAATGAPAGLLGALPALGGASAAPSSPGGASPTLAAAAYASTGATDVLSLLGVSGGSVTTPGSATGNALSELRAMLEPFGLGSLAGKAYELQLQGVSSPDELVFYLESTPEFQGLFPNYRDGSGQVLMSLPERLQFGKDLNNATATFGITQLRGIPTQQLIGSFLLQGKMPSQVQNELATYAYLKDNPVIARDFYGFTGHNPTVEELLGVQLGTHPQLQNALAQAVSAAVPEDVHARQHEWESAYGAVPGQPHDHAFSDMHDENGNALANGQPTAPATPALPTLSDYDIQRGLKQAQAVEQGRFMGGGGRTEVDQRQPDLTV